MRNAMIDTQDVGDPRGDMGAMDALASRRGLLALLSALPAVFGLVIEAGPAPVDAKKKKKKRKKKRRKRGGGDGGGVDGPWPDGEETAFLALINDYRAANGRGPLSHNPQLGAAAENHSHDQAKNNYLGHTGSDGSSIQQRIQRAGYADPRAWGENVAAGYPSASDAFQGWKTSPGHDANMLGAQFTEIGIGRAYNAGSRYGWYWTTTFGARS
jgi:uncharacterized protein YkwD